MLDHYLDLLAEIHRIDPAVFEKLGMPHPRTAAERSLGDLARWEASTGAARTSPSR